MVTDESIDKFKFKLEMKTKADIRESSHIFLKILKKAPDMYLI